ncbi:DUF2255 family protein [Streptomonospora nanhaiensis]|uniref:DUF2255 family protein n=1 Tax=Streptomonospora nanhaiensis TaxID=1323731 RepID=A0ABY6YTX2_9ACTN|nr:DUF2255 family protein [Streptomonospora nanhaiensis]WAE75774.1 DUF2255 family protein [Streptomonospora nanhaiensis]
MTWTPEELTLYSSTEEIVLTVAHGRRVLRRGRRVWVVREGDDLYVRSLGGHASDWYRSARIHRKGTVRAAGLRRNVVFEPADPGTRERVDAAYRLKYGHYAAAFLDTVTGDQAASTTLRLVPCATRTQAPACSAAALPAGRGSRIRSPLGPAGRWHALFERQRRQEEKA